jgi:hypothetical protein
MQKEEEKKPQRICEGDGTCLQEQVCREMYPNTIHRDHDKTCDIDSYNEQHKDPDVLCEHDCKPVPCPMCDNKTTQWLLADHTGRCPTCDGMIQARLRFVKEHRTRKGNQKLLWQLKLFDMYTSGRMPEDTFRLCIAP